MRRFVHTLSALAFVLLCTGVAHASPLSVLLDGGSITAGDKVFSNWTVIQYISSDGRTFNPGNIEVIPLEEPGRDYGLRFVALGNELAVTGDGIYAFLDLTLGFKVTAAGALIKDNWLEIGSALATTNPDGFEDLGTGILEWVGDGLVRDPATPGAISVEFSALNGQLTSLLTASSNFDPRREIWVTKDILVWATNLQETSTLGSFDQRFSQTTPEPATLALLMLGLAGAGCARRRRN